MLNHIANTLSANRNGRGLGIVTMSGAKIVALVNQAHTTTPVRHVHPRFRRDVEHGSPTSRLEALPGLERSGVGQQPVLGRVSGSWQSAWSLVRRVLKPMQSPLCQADARSRPASDTATGTQDRTPRYARAWIYGS
jgi:hypothetical protein